MKKALFSILALVLALGLAIPMAAPATAHTETEPFATDLIAGGGNPESAMDVGDVLVWNDGDNLYVKFIVTAEGWCLTETHLHVATSLDGIPQKNGNPIPGQFDYKAEHDYVVAHTYQIPLTWDAGTGLCIAAHAVVVAPIDDCYETVWQIGDVEVVNVGTQWLENYADEFNWGDPAGPITPGPSLAVEQPAFTNPFIEGTTPTDEFPFNSNSDRNYATDFDVQWSGRLPFGGMLTISWSPGASAKEIKKVGGDGIPATTFIATGASSPGKGWFMDRFPLVENSVAVGSLPDGTHSINFKQTEGNGTYWDWVLLEKPCEQEETAWGAGLDFPGNNWATYFTYHVQGLVGNWQLDFYFPGKWSHDMTITSQSGGTLSGMGGYPATGPPYSHPWTMTGTVSDSSVNMTIVYGSEAPNPGYEVWAKGTVAPDLQSMSGTCNTSIGQLGRWEANRIVP